MGRICVPRLIEGSRLVSQHGQIDHISSGTEATEDRKNPGQVIGTTVDGMAVGLNNQIPA